MDSFLERFAKDRKVRRDPSTKFAVSHDKWDRRTADQIAEEVKDYKMAERELGNKVKTGYEAMTDTLFSLFKANPHLKDPKQVRPSYMINHRVVDEMMKLKEWARGRDISIGDPVGAGLAAATMEPHLEALFDKMQEAQKQAQELEQMLGQAEDYADKIDDLMDQAQNADTEQDAQDFQDQADKLQEQLEQLMQQMQDAQDDLNKELDDHQADMKSALTAGLKELGDQNDALQQIDSWGMNSGGYRKMNPEARLALTKKLQTEKFRKMAELFGRMQSVAMSEQVNRAEYASDEIYDLEQGSDLSRVIPPEMLALNDEHLVLDWLHRYVEHSLVQYSLRGDDTVVKGGIILLEDGSSSMAGTREIWSKAIGLALLKVAIMQKRPFYAVNFAGPGSYITFDFDTTKSELRMVKAYNGSSQEYHGPEAIVEYAESAMHGGTDFMTPLALGLDLLRTQHDELGATEGDIVFLTDGECGVPDSFMKEFKAEQARLEFKVFGVAIQTSPKSEPLNTITDGKCIGLKQLTDASDVSELFAAV